MSSLTAATAKHRGTFWRGEKAWHWFALYTGHVQPRGYRTYWQNRRRWQLHLTPVHLMRDGEKRAAGMCWGRRTVLVFRHR